MLIQLLRLIKLQRPRTPRRVVNVLANNRKELATPVVNSKHHVFRASNTSTPSTLPQCTIIHIPLKAKREERNRKTSTVTAKREQGIPQTQNWEMSTVTAKRVPGIPKTQNWKTSTVTVKREPGIPRTQNWKTSMVTAKRVLGIPRTQNKKTSTVTAKRDQRIPKVQTITVMAKSEQQILQTQNPE